MTFHVKTSDLKRAIPTDNRLKPHAAMVTGTYIPFWKRDPRALREAETRLTYKDHPAHAPNLAKAKRKLALNKPARQLLLVAVKNKVGRSAMERGLYEK